MPPTGVLIAVVDDEESVRKALGRLIGSAGFDVLTFASGVEFLSAARELSPQCVVLDVRMPHMDGFELQQALLRGDRPVPVPSEELEADISDDDVSKVVKLRWSGLLVSGGGVMLPHG